jgi:putative sigma-54 modulation protein
MNIIIRSVNFKASIRLQNFIREKVGKVFSKSDTILSAEVVLREDDTGDIENKSCQIRLSVPGEDHFVKTSSEVYEKSILQAVELLQRKIRIRKRKLISRRYAVSA